MGVEKPCVSSVPLSCHVMLLGVTVPRMAATEISSALADRHASAICDDTLTIALWLVMCRR